MIKKILITGANSYIGTSFEKYILENYQDEYQVDTLDMMDSHWKEYDFTGYDSVFHVAGIAHADVGNASEETKKLYYKVNTDLTIETVLKTKESGVKQFIYMSSMIVYSGCKETFITREVVPKAKNFYGDSKLKADLAVQKLANDEFKVCVIRPPMIYGKGSKGNYPLLTKLATKMPVFPIVKNRRSMLHIDNLCEFVRLMIDNEESGVFFPQNEEYTNTSDMVQLIANVKGHKINMIPGCNPVIKVLTKVPGKIGDLVYKAFGNSYYDKKMSAYKQPYNVWTLKESIINTESDDQDDVNILKECKKKKILLIALPGYSKGIKDKMIDVGYNVLHINDKPNDGVMCKILGRLKLPIYMKIIDNYYRQKLKPYEGVYFDYIVSIRGEYTPESTLEYLKTVFPQAIRILYMWDSIVNNKDIGKKWCLYDKVFTFDRIDYIQHKDKLNFLPLYYYEDYLPKLKKVNVYKYDIAFIGTGHGDRVKIANEVKKQCKENSLNCFVYIYSPHLFIYLRNRLLNPDYKGVKFKDINFEMIPFKKAYEIYGNSKCIIDIESKNQNGLTMRTIEMIGLRKKIITTNKDIRNYDFYNENNVMLSDRVDFKIDLKFVQKEYEELNDSIYEKYSLTHWVKTLLGENDI